MPHISLVTLSRKSQLKEDWLSPRVLTPEMREKLEAMCNAVRVVRKLGYTVLAQIMPKYGKPKIVCCGQSLDALSQHCSRPVWIDNRRHAELDGVWIVWEQAQ